jgi:hypothetical protein
VICACTTESRIPEHPEDVPIASINQYINVVAPPAWNNFQADNPIDLRIENISGRTIVFDSDFGQRIFVEIDDHWTEVKDDLENINLVDIRLEKNETRGLSIRINEKSNFSLVRIYVVGRFEDTQEKVSAFIDVYLRP